MAEATVIYPHQLYKKHPALKKNRIIFLVAEPLLLNEFPAHRQRLLLLRLAMQAYKKVLVAAGYQVTVLEIEHTSSTMSQLEKIVAAGFTTWHLADTTDDWLEKRLNEIAKKHKLTLVRYESPLFILPKAEAIERYQKSKRHMARFYQGLRQKLNILMDDGEPQGGSWSFDVENRKKLPGKIELPAEPKFYTNPDIETAKTWLANLPGEHYGDSTVWLPYTHETAEAWLDDFLTERFENFGPYEDALSTRGVRLFHSALSPLMNIGLLSPQQVIDKALAHAVRFSTPLPSLEGFIRQILGWREFIRAAYESDGRRMRTQNFWQHERTLPDSWWTGETGLLPVDQTIKTALKYGYNHHIERLMVLGNYLLLTETNPNEVYRWFMAMYVDAYDWVMVPNVYGMSQFADGGSFATKPYISGSNYLRKMSDYQGGDWVRIFDALYWHFIAKNETYFRKNHRLSMMPMLLKKMKPDRRQELLKLAKQYLSTIA